MARSGAWNELSQIVLDLYRPDHPNDKNDLKNPASWRYALLGLCFKSAGGIGNLSDYLPLAWSLFMKSAFYLDSLEDQDPILLKEYEKNQFMNGAIGMLLLAFYSLDLFLQDENYDDRSYEITRKFHQTLMDACSSQSRELSLTTASVHQWWEIAAAKSGGPYSLACWAGARMATNDLLLLDQIRSYGYHLGIVVQLIDDAEDFLPEIETDKKNSWSDIGCSLPIAFALDELPPNSRTHLESLLTQVRTTNDPLDEIFEIVQGCGASIYMETEIRKHRLLAIQAIASGKFHSPARDELINILENISLSQ